MKVATLYAGDSLYVEAELEGDQIRFRRAVDRIERVRKTSSCPMVAGVAGFESWPDPIVLLLVKEPRFLSADAGMVCN
jgi:hypothetical protein